MTSVWQGKPTIDEPQYDAMASILEGRHGVLAAAVADFFAAAHLQNGDEDRASAWSDVAERVRDRMYERQHT
jgi:hypothetical protein